jgi:hypothetical protein
LAEQTTSVSITRTGSRSEPIAASLGRAAARVLSYLIQVVDREDRLESGSGRFREELEADADGRWRAVEDAVLRALRLAAEPINYRILERLAKVGVIDVPDLVSLTGLPRLSIEERVSDLTSAGLAAKVTSAGQVGGTEAGTALVGLIRDAVAAGSSELGQE